MTDSGYNLMKQDILIAVCCTGSQVQFRVDLKLLLAPLAYRILSLATDDQIPTLFDGILHLSTAFCLSFP